MVYELAVPEGEEMTIGGEFPMRLVFQLQWCVLPDRIEDKTFRPVNVQMEINRWRRPDGSPGPDIGYTIDPSSGISLDGRCVRIEGESDLFTVRASLAGLRFIVTPANVERRLVAPSSSSDEEEYVPAGVNVVVVQTQNTTEDPGPQALVEDDEPPVFTYCPGDIEVTGEPGESQAAVSWNPPVVTDNIRVDTVTQTHISGQQFAVGSHQVVFTATDVSGLQATCAFSVTVQFVSTDFDMTEGVLQEQISYSAETSALGHVLTGDVLVAPRANLTVGSFAVDIGQYSSLSVQIEPRAGDRFVLGFRDDGNVPTRIAVDLHWTFNESDVNFPVTLNETAHDVLATLQLVGGPATIAYGTWFSMDAASHVYQTENHGSIRIKGQTALLPGELAFNSLRLSLQFPGGRPLTGKTPTFTLTDGSHASFRYLRNYGSAAATMGLDMDDLRRYLNVEDTLAPVFTVCPDDQNVATDPGLPTAVVNFATPAATDNHAVYSLTGTHAPGHAFPLTLPNQSPTVVTYTAVDLSGNVANCTFTVTVADTEKPTVECPTDMQLTMDLNVNYATVLIMPVNYSDNSGQSVWTAPTSRYYAGNTTTQILVNDFSDNTNSCSLVVTVTDNQPPIITNCPGDQALPPISEIEGTSVYWLPPAASDNHLLDAWNSTHAPGDRFVTGATKVVYRALDVSGNNASCEFTIVIAEAEAAAALSSTAQTGVGVGVGIAVLLVAVLSVVIYRQRFHHKPANFDEVFEQLEGLMDQDEAVRVPIEIKRSAVTRLDVLGQGNFGAVHKGVYKEEGRPAFLVAVKTLHGTLTADRDEILREAAIMVRSRHRKRRKELREEK